MWDNNTLYNSILIYLVMVALIIAIKPNFIYDHKNKRFREFGIGDNKTPLSFPVLCMASAMTVYFLTTATDAIDRI